MAVTFGFYHDAALTQPIDSGNPLTATQDGGNVLGPVIKPVWLGSTTVGNVLDVTSDPGVDPVQVSIYDASIGTGADPAEVKLALTTGGLAGATGGAPLDLAPTLTSGVANAVQFYVQYDSAITVPGTLTDLRLRVENPYEHAAP